MRKQPLLSIVIPTRNREKYAINCIQSILNFDFDNFELVIQDNSDGTDLKTFIETLTNDHRLIYHYDNSPLNTVHNFNKAMDYVCGEYVCFIGDDDGINPEIFDAVTWAKEKGIEALVGKSRIGYLWPNENRGGRLSIYPFTGKISSVNVEKELQRFLKGGGVYYLKYDLPKVYHGIVKKLCFDKVKNKLGYYFGGLSVDIFSSISISLFAQKVVSIDYPLTIAGSSAASEQTHRTIEAKIIELKDAPHFRARGQYIWSDKVPPVYSGATIWAESCINALEAFNRGDLVKMINRFKLSAHIILGSPQHEKSVLNIYLNKNKKFFITQKFYLAKWSILVKTILQKVDNRVLNKIHRKTIQHYEGVDSIADAVIITKEYFEKYDKKLSNYLHN